MRLDAADRDIAAGELTGSPTVHAYQCKTPRSKSLQAGTASKCTKPQILVSLTSISTAQLGTQLASTPSNMLWTSFVAILMLWCVAIATSFTLSGLIHLLPVCAAAVAFIGRMQARDLI
jgi:hypothetical protein